MDDPTRGSGRVGSENLQEHTGRVGSDREVACHEKSATVLAAADDRISHDVRDCAESPICISACSAQSERDFSSVVTNIWSCLNEETVEAVEVLR